MYFKTLIIKKEYGTGIKIYREIKETQLGNRG